MRQSVVEIATQPAIMLHQSAAEMVGLLLVNTTGRQEVFGRIGRQA